MTHREQRLPAAPTARPTAPAIEILLVEDEATIRTDLALALGDAGYQVTEASDGAEALALIAARSFDIAICDIGLPKVDGLTLFHRIRERSPEVAVVLISGQASVADAVAALRDGAFDYVAKPFDSQEFTLRVIGRAAERQRLRQALESERSRRDDAPGLSALIGRSPPMIQLLERLETIAQSDAPVLIGGESGTGKEIVAKLLHERGQRRDKPFITVNCAALPEALLEAELFGHERGAFTGAEKRRDGRFKAADGGTLLLDEVAELPLSSQGKLLRVLQEGVFEPLGSDVSVAVDVRILSATHQSLKQCVAEHRFREDLYYRLNVLDLSLPPLRERRSDLPLLLQHFLARFTSPGAGPVEFSPRAWAALSEYPFPGNVRELEHAVERAVLLARGREIDLEHLPEDIAGALSTAAAPEPGLRPLGEATREFEREYLLRALRLSGGRRAEAAKLLGISRKNLWQKLRLHGLGDFKGE